MRNREHETIVFSSKSILADPHALQTLALIVIHQSIIAASALFLTLVVENFQQGRPYLRDLFFYFLAMTAPFIPGCLSFLTLTKWQNRIHKKYISEAREIIGNRIDLHKNNSFKNEFTGVISRNSFATISLVCSYLHNSATFFLNSLLSILVIGFILPPHLSLGYIISAAISIVAIFVVSPVISRKTVALENSNISYGGDLSKIWANLTIGNSYNKKLWEEAIKHSGEDYYQKSKNLSLIKQANNFLLGMIALLPTMYLIYEAARSPSIPAAVVAAIIVNLTRIIHILNSFGALIYQAVDLKSVFSRVEVLRSILKKLEDEAKTLPFQANGIVMVNGAQIGHFGQMIDIIDKTPVGRYTVTGENGAGKSTLLAYLKDKYGERCLLLPAHASELTWETAEGKASTGQTLLSIVNEIVVNSAAEILLLDEWDANLDVQNKRTINARLDLVAQKRIVVEVRHGELALAAQVHQ